ncbi:PucR family transcriptional regulator [Nocardia cyriacigeorgica]|uniref:PucR family transcriptional regulator n=1 Tax=Nocardia cyriacigeorgica TaxID=135487 RepID=UPI0013D7BA0E|nr:helix-turn-helix domain-containing protein [Nocardia cyriacigeorgica]NEW26642.1 PucR family transcriptional regulator [Nocardia cyriacigeorgica]
MPEKLATRDELIETHLAGGEPSLSQPVVDGLVDIDRLAQRLAAHFTVGIALREQSAGIRRGETALSRECLRLAIGAADGGEGIEQLAQAGARWARQGIMIDTVLHAVHDALRVGLDLIARRDTPDSNDPTPEARAELRRTTGAVIDLLDLVTSTVSQGYVREMRSAIDPRHGAPRTLAAALISGESISTTARECGIELDDEYWVLALMIPPPRARSGGESRIADRRTLQRVEAELARASGGQALPLLSIDGGTVLVPGTVHDARLDRMFDDLTRAAGVPITATVVHAQVTDIPAGTEHAHGLLDMVRRLEMTGVLHRFADLALEYQLTRPGPGRAFLAGLLDPIDEFPELLETLARYVATGLNRRLTARALHVHPNTVDSRLKRIAALTGFETAPSNGLWHLRSALVARSYLASPPRG